MKQVNQYVTREELLEALWDEVAFVDDNTLTVNVKRKEETRRARH